MAQGTHAPCQLPGTVRSSPIPQPPLLFPSLAPGLLESVAILKSEHRGLFSSIPNILTYWGERERETEKQDCVGRRGKCMGTVYSLDTVANDSRNLSPKCPACMQGCCLPR